MTLWKRALAALKDQKSLLATKANFSRRRRGNQRMECAMIHATSHDESRVDYCNAYRVFKWIRTSRSVTIRPFLLAISSRVNRTRSWIVSLKCLMLIHGVLCLKHPAIEDIRPLPFDLSDFSDGHCPPSKVWGFNSFVRAYFSYLDRYSSFLSDQIKTGRERRRRMIDNDETTEYLLFQIQKLQSLLDLLIQIRPMADKMKTPLILDVMDCVVIDIIDIYGRICNAIAKLLVKINPAAERSEASTALKIIQIATAQGEDLSLYFEFCKKFGVPNAHEIPKFVKIPEDDIRTIENVINGVEETPDKEEKEEEKAIILIERNNELKTIITEDWEVFDDILDSNQEKMDKNGEEIKQEDRNLPLELFNQPHQNYLQEIPDLITF